MASTKIIKRLEEIKAQASSLAINAEDKAAANLAEEAAELGLELAAALKEEKS